MNLRQYKTLSAPPRPRQRRRIDWQALGHDLLLLLGAMAASVIGLFVVWWIAQLLVVLLGD